MKTPRDLLLEKHRAATPKLDAIRLAAIEEAAGGAAGTESDSLAAALWRELFWSCRRVWCGVAVAWAVILLLNVAASVDPHQTVTASHATPVRIAQSLAERQRLQSELLGLNPVNTPAEEPHPAVTRPRSQVRVVTATC